MKRAAVLDPKTNIVINVIMANDIYVLPNLVQADEAGNIGDWWSGTEFIPPYDSRHPLYVAPKGK